MGEASTVAGNTEEGKAAGRISTRLTSALEGVTKAFETTSENLDQESVEAKINGAFSEYYLTYKQAVQTVERNGMAISENVIAAADRLDGTDWESGSGFLRRVDVPPPMLRSPDYYDPNHILREINNKPSEPGPGSFGRR
ncbi:hypothetical protein GCM10007079_22510 [Nocardiopsis terrae]|uniref:Excreted virulence factor EspC, type VII ESX diderm n=1 Tax=Nocardiopsis terrae TaxID=372655 RepID=A0ABR9HGH7_9ACTN|nr:hypothetical protein [Nocardiopsis terrae]MBE1458136.1 hypothetical protein [Nocardiopsis terrae]GHC81968.1 hypothetical protein GCM10007079_22510 [Nocardiopsis terrae]